MYRLCCLAFVYNSTGIPCLYYKYLEGYCYLNMLLIYIVSEIISKFFGSLGNQFFQTLAVTYVLLTILHINIQIFTQTAIIT